MFGVKVVVWKPDAKLPVTPAVHGAAADPPSIDSVMINGWIDGTLDMANVYVVPRVRMTRPPCTAVLMIQLLELP